MAGPGSAALHGTNQKLRCSCRLFALLVTLAPLAQAQPEQSSGSRMEPSATTWGKRLGSAVNMRSLGRAVTA